MAEMAGQAVVRRNRGARFWPTGVLLLCWLLACATLVSVGAGAHEFRAADSQPGDYPSVQALHYMAELIAARSDGRHSVRTYDSAQLGPEVDTVELVRAGIIDIDRLNIATFNDEIIETQVASMPFLFRSEQHARQVFDGPIGADILASFERHGLVALAFYEASPRSFFTVHGALRKPADFRGLRLRTLPSALMVAMVEALGATPAYVPYGQIKTALSADLIDGAENNLLSYWRSGLSQATPFYSETRHTFSPGVLLMSQKAWDPLSDADRTLFRTAAQDSALFLRRLWAESEVNARAALRERGIHVVDDVDRPALAAAMEPVYARFATQPAIRDLIVRIRALP